MTFDSSRSFMFLTPLLPPFLHPWPQGGGGGRPGRPPRGSAGGEAHHALLRPHPLQAVRAPSHHTSLSPSLLPPSFSPSHPNLPVSTLSEKLILPPSLPPSLPPCFSVYDKIQDKIRNEKPFTKALIGRALSVAEERRLLLQEGESPGPFLSLQYKVLDKIGE